MPDDRRIQAWLWLAGIVVLFALPATAAPENPLISFDIQPQSLVNAVVEFAAQADVSIGYPGLELGGHRSQGVIGHYQLGPAVSQLLKGTGLGFRVIDEKTVRILRAPPTQRSRKVRSAPIALTIKAPVIEEVVVTSTKRPGEVQSLPYSITAVTGNQLRQWNIEDDTEVALRISGVTMTNRGAGRNKIILRGLSDGNFTGRTQSAVGLYLDDTRITFNAPDPGLKLLDIDRVEVLRGPQGTLYGAGSLGGLFRVVTNKPLLDEVEASATLSGSLTRGGDPSHQVTAMLNIPLVEDVLAVRGVVYRQRDGGYIDDIQLGLKNVNTTTTTGARFSTRWRLSDRWQATGGLNVQTVRADDTQYYDGDLPRFQRANFLREPHKNDFLQPYLTIDGNFSWGRLVSATSYIRHDVDDVFDASRAVPLLSGLPIVASPFKESRNIQTIIHETRLASNEGGRFQWLAGVFVSHRDEVFKTRFDIPGSGQALNLGTSDILFAERRVDNVSEVAVFGELTYWLTKRLSLTTGLRWFRSRLAATSVVDEPLAGGIGTTTGLSTTSGETPKFVVGFQLTPDILLHAQAAEGNRVGGLNLQGPLVIENDLSESDGMDNEADTLSSFPSDHLWNFEIGAKTSFLDRRLIFNLAAFYVIWNEIQSDQIGINGFPFVIDAGDARIKGVEAEITARPSRGLSVHANLTLNDGRLSEATPVLGAKIDNQLPGVPKVSAGVAAQYETLLGAGLIGSIGGDYAFIGKSSLGFDTLGSPRMGGYHLGNLRLGISWAQWRVTLFVDNLWDEGTNSFAFGNPFSLGLIKQVTPLRPRSAGLRINRIY